MNSEGEKKKCERVGRRMGEYRDGNRIGVGWERYQGRQRE